MSLIPKSFTVFGEKHKVSFVKNVSLKVVGEWIPEKNRIRIKADLAEDRKEQIYMHELTHCILDHLSYSDLSSDESFVDRFSKALHQVLKTSEY